MQTQAQRAAYQARLYSEHMANLRKKAVPVPRINPLTGKPLETEMAKQARVKQDKLDADVTG